MVFFPQQVTFGIQPLPYLYSYLRNKGIFLKQWYISKSPSTMVPKPASLLESPGCFLKHRVLLNIKLLWTFMSRHLCAQVLSFLLGNHLKMQWPVHMIGACLPFLRDSWTVFQSGCVILYSQQQWISIPVAPHPHQHLQWLVFLNFSHSYTCGGDISLKF